MTPAKQTGQVRVAVHIDACSGDHGQFYGAQEYTVDKKTAEWLLADARVATPVRSSSKTEHATANEEG